MFIYQSEKQRQSSEDVERRYPRIKDPLIREVYEDSIYNRPVYINPRTKKTDELRLLRSYVKNYRSDNDNFDYYSVWLDRLQDRLKKNRVKLKLVPVTQKQMKIAA